MDGVVVGLLADILTVRDALLSCTGDGATV